MSEQNSIPEATQSKAVKSCPAVKLQRGVAPSTRARAANRQLPGRVQKLLETLGSTLEGLGYPKKR
jgi:hypothetical protein